jgi:O-Antigen ligase
VHASSGIGRAERGERLASRVMRRAVSAVAAACVLAGPTVLAFFSGGYFAEPLVISGIVVWALVLALAVIGPAPLPAGGPGRVAFGGLAGFAAWSAVSLAWAPLGAAAVHNLQRLVLYIGAFLLAVGVLRSPRALRAAEPALAAGAAVVIGYGLAGRLLPGIVELARSESADGRLEQPITYWNGTGGLAAMGFLLCARLAGDRTRPTTVRAAAAAATAPLGAGIYLSFSRGAIAVALLGLVVLVAAAPTRSQLRAAAVALATGAVAAVAGAVFDGVAMAESDAGDGAIVLAIVATLAAAATIVTARLGDHRPPADPVPSDHGTSGDDRLPWAGLLKPLAAAAVAAAAIGLVIGGLGERPSAAELATGAGAERLTTASSNRYEYWRVGLDAFAREPLTGLGSGGFRVAWLKERSIAEAVRDTHSLEVEAAAELGIPGLVALALLIGGVAAAARRALRSHGQAAAGAVAVTLAWLLHASIDWDWQLAAVTLPALVLAGALVVLSESGR